MPAMLDEVRAREAELFPDRRWCASCAKHQPTTPGAVYYLDSQRNRKWRCAPCVVGRDAQMGKVSTRKQNP